MKLKDTVELMTSDKWKDRFLAEYLQARIRFGKLHFLIVKRELNKLEFGTKVPLSSWKAQLLFMSQYINELEKQAAYHNIDLMNRVELALVDEELPTGLKYEEDAGDQK